jgi:hypothetical protein
MEVLLENLIELYYYSRKPPQITIIKYVYSIIARLSVGTQLRPPPRGVAQHVSREVRQGHALQ